MGKIIERFDKYMLHKGLNDNKVTNKIGISNGLIGKCRSKGRDMSKGLIAQVLQAYPDLSRDWLINGDGDMLKDNTDAVNTDSPQSELEYYKSQLGMIRELLKEKEKYISMIQPLADQALKEMLERNKNK